MTSAKEQDQQNITITRPTSARAPDADLSAPSPSHHHRHLIHTSTYTTPRAPRTRACCGVRTREVTSSSPTLCGPLILVPLQPPPHDTHRMECTGPIPQMPLERLRTRMGPGKGRKIEVHKEAHTLEPAEVHLDPPSPRLAYPSIIPATNSAGIHAFAVRPPVRPVNQPAPSSTSRREAAQSGRRTPPHCSPHERSSRRCPIN
jgi:hypothetical protein